MGVELGERVGPTQARVGTGSKRKPDSTSTFGEDCSARGAAYLETSTVCSNHPAEALILITKSRVISKHAPLSIEHTLLTAQTRRSIRRPRVNDA